MKACINMVNETSPFPALARRSYQMHGLSGYGMQSAARILRHRERHPPLFAGRR